MRIGVLCVAVFAFLFTACPSTPPVKTAAKKSAVERSFKTFQAFNQLSLLSSKPRLQAETAACDSGSATYSVTEGAQSASVTITTGAAGCTEGDTTFTTGASGFTFSVSATGNETSGSFTLGFNGTLTIKTPEENSSVTFNNFTFTISYNISGNTATYTLTVNGSVTTEDGQLTFSNETYSLDDFDDEGGA
jgi:hypothetical protein